VNSFLLALMLLFPVAQPPTNPQAIHVGGNYSSVDIAKAQAIIAATQPKELKLKVGEFEIIEPSKDAKPLQFQYLTNNCYRLYQVQPGETLVMVGVRRGDTERRLHRFEAKPYRWAVIEAVLQGSEVVVVNRNGAIADKDPPEEVERVLVLVGEPKPEPPPKPVDPPVEDALLKAFREAAQKDAAAGKADKRWILPLAGVYKSTSLDSLESLKTISDLDSRLNAMRVAADIPEPATQFFNLRMAIRIELLSRLGVSDVDSAKELTPGTRRLAKLAMGQISTALEVLAK